MHAFIDDSGDTGFKFDAGSTRHFVIACCVFESPESAERTANKIRKFKNDLGWSSMEELKFSKTRPENRFNFLSQVCSNDFFVRAIVVDKRVIRSEYLITQPRTFYSYIINQVLTHASGTICDAKVKIDGSGSRKYKEAMQGYLRSQTGSSDFRVVRDVSFVNSKGNQLIQLADMIAGATRRSFDDSQSNSRDYAAALRKVWLQTKSDIWNFK